MATTHTTVRVMLRGFLVPHGSRPISAPPSFLLPVLAREQIAAFSSSSSLSARKDGNPSRGTSPLHRTGLRGRVKLSVKLKELPQPVLDPAKRSKVQVDENHGLWQFFNAEKAALMTPEELQQHGRGWTLAELRNKDWDDLHRLWWVCIKERNKINTFMGEYERVKPGYGDFEAVERLTEIKKTQKAIKHCLTERWYAWENAREVAMEDDEVNLHADLEQGEPAFLSAADAEADAVYVQENPQATVQEDLVLLRELALQKIRRGY